MINREMKSATVYSYTEAVDDYGQKRQGTATQRNIQMFTRLYQQKNVSDPRYVEVEVVGLTKDNSLVLSDQIVIDSITYNILFIVPTSRYNEILMKKA